MTTYSRSCRERPSHRRQRGFTLIELLVVIAIIALLVSILLPSLRMARELAQSSICGSNLHGIFTAASFYSTDYNGFLSTPLLMYQSVWNPDGPPMPEIYIGNGPTRIKVFYNTNITDFYLALDYIPFTEIEFKDHHSRFVAGNEILFCPVLESKVGFEGMFYRYSGNYGRTYCSFFFSSLLTWQGREDRNDPKRTNTIGPYKQEELADPGDAFFAGDAICFDDPHSSYNSDYVMSMWFGYSTVGQRSTCFGAVVTSANVLTDPHYYYHSTSPNGLFWDGHVSAVDPPAIGDPHALRRHVTRDGN